MPTLPSCLIIDGDRAHARALEELCGNKGFLVHAPPDLHRSTAGEIQDVVGARSFTVAFLDSQLGPQALFTLASSTFSDTELFVMAEADESLLAEHCARARISHYFCKPFSPVNIGDLLTDIYDEQSAFNTQPTAQCHTQPLNQFGLIRGSSQPMHRLFRLLRKFAPTDTTALIIGESGTGKELIAETLHTASPRSSQPYLTLNCAALAETLIESELFGHEKGSFSGAQQRHRGFFERADGGTLFLDEITEMSADLQAKLLRVLESGEIRRVGSVDPRCVDVRVIAASNRDPSNAVKEGKLREDLYYRLAHIVIQIPPLRDRGEDLQGLALLFLKQLNEKHGTSVSISSDALKSLDAHTWPGNVRELRHSVERAYILSDKRINTAHMLQNGSAGLRSSLRSDHIAISVGKSMADYEKTIILATLSHFKNNKKETAEMLGMSLKTLYSRLKSYDTSAIEVEKNENTLGSVRQA